MRHLNECSVPRGAVGGEKNHLRASAVLLLASRGSTCPRLEDSFLEFFLGSCLSIPDCEARGLA